MHILKAYREKYRGSLKPESCLMYEAAQKSELYYSLNKIFEG